MRWAHNMGCDEMFDGSLGCHATAWVCYLASYPFLVPTDETADPRASGLSSVLNMNEIVPITNVQNLDRGGEHGQPVAKGRQSCHANTHYETHLIDGDTGSSVGEHASAVFVAWSI